MEKDLSKQNDKDVVLKWTSSTLTTRKWIMNEFHAYHTGVNHG
jgi:hypothetical protein